MARSFTRLITTPAAARMARDWNRPFVSLLTDFGSRDPSPAICRGVVLGIAPDALIVDISHDVDKFQVRDGALLLWCALPYLPVGSHAAVVDPGVGTARRGIAIETERGDMLVGPDNGLLLPGAERLGGIVRAHELLNGQYRLPVVSTSFHGRDLFAPAAAHLALGVPLEMMGPPVDPRDLEALEWPQPEIRDGELVASIIYLDTFGNVKLAALAPELSMALGQIAEGQSMLVRIGSGRRPREEVVTYAQTFGHVPVGEPLLYEDSYGRLCIAVNQGSAVERLGLREGQELTITLVEPLVAPARIRRPVPEPATERFMVASGEAIGTAVEIGTGEQRAPDERRVPVAPAVDADAVAPPAYSWADEPTVSVAPTMYPDADVPAPVAGDLAADRPTELVPAVEAPFEPQMADRGSSDIDPGSPVPIEPLVPAGAGETTVEPPVVPAEPPVRHVTDEEAWEAWATPAPPADAPTAASRTHAGAGDGDARPGRARTHRVTTGPATGSGTGDRGTANGAEPASDEELWRAWQLPEAGKR